jgi:hypothetical protein
MKEVKKHIQKGYIRIADIMPFQVDMRIADIPKLSKIPSQMVNNLNEVFEK